MIADGLARDVEVDACRLGLQLLRHRASTFGCDIPFGEEAAWPPEVRVAAHRLARHSKGRRGGNDGYKMIWRVSTVDTDDWDAFVTFAPYAFDASVWADDCTYVADLADEGTSLEPSEAAALSQFIGSDRVIPMSQWKTVRRRRRREPRSP